MTACLDTMTRVQPRRRLLVLKSADGQGALKYERRSLYPEAMTSRDSPETGNNFEMQQTNSSETHMLDQDFGNT